MLHNFLDQVWDYQTKSCVQTLEGHAHNVSAVCFHPELPIIITGSEDGTVRLWHSTTYRYALACPPSHQYLFIAMSYYDILGDNINSALSEALLFELTSMHTSNADITCCSY
jgi:WD40 repeat protein